MVVVTFPHLLREMHGLGQHLGASGTRLQISTPSHAVQAAASRMIGLRCMLPFPLVELPLNFHLSASTAFARVLAFLAPEIGGVSFAPSAGFKHVFGMPAAAPLALLLQAVVRTLSLATLAKSLAILALPLRLREFCFEGFGVAAVAHVRGHVLLLHGRPVYVLTAQDLQ